MSEHDFSPEPNEALLGQVRTVLTDIYLTTPEDIRSARRRISSTPFDLRLDSIKLLYLYDSIWRPRRSVGFFLCSQLSYPLKKLIT